MKTQDLKQLFWDVDEAVLSSLGDETVISRALSHGSFDQIQDLFSTYGKEVIRVVFVHLKPGALSDRRRDYFTLLLS
jgi:hypothetical protein